jgi:hypothetical protein
MIGKQDRCDRSSARTDVKSQRLPLAIELLETGSRIAQSHTVPGAFPGNSRAVIANLYLKLGIPHR